MTTTALPDGIYRIEALINGAQGQYLTRENSGTVTILLSSAQSDLNQEWQIINVDKGNIIIEVPRFVPGDYLTYKGAPKTPEPGDQIIFRPDPQRPPNEWQVVSRNIRVAGSDLGIKIAPPPIFPPLLALELEDQLEWEFKRVGDA